MCGVPVVWEQGAREAWCHQCGNGAIGLGTAPSAWEQCHQHGNGVSRGQGVIGMGTRCWQRGKRALGAIGEGVGW